MVYSLAWGDQPALICEHVDWARACGFKVVAAGKGTRYEPHYHQSTPDTLWDILDKYLQIDDRGSINPKMFNSFVDGTKSGIEMTAVCNATGLVPQSDGLGFPPASRFELADVCKPRAAAVRSKRSASPRWCRRSIATAATCRIISRSAPMWWSRRERLRAPLLQEYAMLPDRSGRYAALYRPIHMIGLELGVSVASAALRKEPTGAPTGFRSDVVATAKRALKRGRGARRRGRLLRLGPAGAGRALARGGAAAARASPTTSRLTRDVAAGDAPA